MWYQGTGDNWTSMGVITDGNHYDIPKGYCFSMPVKCHNFNYEIITGLDLDPLTRLRINISLKELENEKDQAHLE